MLRKLHSWPGVALSVLVMVVALSGVTLALQPTLTRLDVGSPLQGVSAAVVASRITQQVAGVELIERAPSGEVRVTVDSKHGGDTVRVDPRTGAALGSYEPGAFMAWMRDLHRSFFSGDVGRGVSGVVALAMALLSLSGVVLLARKMGGWRMLLSRSTGDRSQRWHSAAGRLGLPGLILLSVTGLYMSGVTFGLIDDGMALEPAYPGQVAQGPHAAVADLKALKAVDIADLRELEFPKPNDSNGVITLRTASGDGYVDPASGELLNYQAHTLTRRVYETVYQLHTGEGYWWLSLLCGLCVSTVPLLAITGTLIWWQRRRLMPTLRANVGAQQADTVVLVGSQSATTWAFASAVHDALTNAGHAVHTATMNSLQPRYRQAKRLLVLTSTYGDGHAPDSASAFMARLQQAQLGPDLSVAVLGFGDSRFKQFCAYAHRVQDALQGAGCSMLLPLATVDRGDAEAFSQWGRALAEQLGGELLLQPVRVSVPTRSLELIERVVYGETEATSTAVLRFAPVPGTGRNLLSRLLGKDRLPAFEPGDLLGVVPSRGEEARFYSIATSRSDGVVEICVRRHAQGLCSGYLHTLPLGGRIEAFVQQHPHFRPSAGQAPVILVGAGTGIGPLVGFIRKNHRARPINLYWGGRSATSEFLYEDELGTYLEDGRLHHLSTAFSRGAERAYVQDRIRADALKLQALIQSGAQVLVCGGREMAESVRQVFDGLLAPICLNVETLNVQGRYREDVF
ncbi:PepSY-associated TM helix domain-containing protein [Pseudomonas defluvii]|uniref:PepSY-associated TM helix domain-containing protein n=1 Tax=Pseudomonas defluvii TaxID=1876757 RepID=UPI003905D4A2